MTSNLANCYSNSAVVTATIPVAVADVLSPSQCKTFLQCSARWYLKYVEQLPDVCTGNLALGRAVHAAVAQHFRYRQTNGRIPPFAEILETYGEAIRRELETAELRDDEDAEELAATGARCVEAYLTQAAPAITPALVEHPVTGEIGGVRVRGYVDLMDVDGRIIDLKTASKKPAAITADYKLQLAMYVMTTPGATSARLDTITKQKTPQWVPQSYTLDDGERRYVETLLPILQDGMKDGRYWPSRDHNLCSRKYCPFWRACEQEFGGQVKA
jgi:RecB family exonuclease